jgi:Protein of unknown function (DUF3563)
MRAQSPNVTDPGFIALCIQLAQATFAKDMPALSGPKVPVKRPSAISEPRRFLASIDNWFYRRQLQEREAYLAQSTDIFDLERRIRHLDRRPYY